MMRVWRNFLRSPSGVAGLVIVGLLSLVALLAPVLLGDYAQEGSVRQALQPPSSDHWLGTDELGRDVLARLLVATRLSIGLGLCAVVISAAIGIPLGALVTIVSPRMRGLILRTNDIMLGFPAIILGIYACVVLGRGALGPIVGVGIAGSFAYLRITSTLALSIGDREYVNAARVVGVSGPKLLFRHVLPNVADTLIISTTVNVSTAIVAISGLSFLGLGVQSPDFDWGEMLTSGINNLYFNMAGALGPALAIVITAVGFGLFGEALARALNPMLSSRQRGSASTAGVLKAPAPESGTQEDTDSPVEQNSLAVDVRDLRVRFPVGQSWVELVRGVSLHVAVGERVGIVGESGSGKTMTAMAIAQLVSFPGAVTGEIRVADRMIVPRPTARVRGHADPEPLALSDFLSEHVSVVFQDPITSLNPAMRIGSQLTEAVRHHQKLSRAVAEERAVHLLREVQVTNPAQQMKRFPHELSGGMRQRVLIAMALMREPRLLIADEPTTALDVTIQAQIMNLLGEVTTRRDMALILISHNLGLIRQSCDRAVVMYAGEIVEVLPTSQLDDPRHPYTKALLAAVPDITHPRDQRLADIQGQAPDLADPPGGCAFHPRCPLASEICRTTPPVLTSAADGRKVACWAVVSKEVEVGTHA